MALALKKESSRNPNPNSNPNLEEGVEQLGRRNGGHRRHRLLHGGLLLDALRLVIG